MAIGDIHIRLQQVGVLVVELHYVELEGHDPENDADNLELTTPLRVSGVGFLVLMAVDDNGIEVYERTVDVAVVEGEWDEYRIRVPTLRTMNDNHMRMSYYAELPDSRQRFPGDASKTL